MVVEEIAALDLWTLFVVYTFGSFFISVIGITLLLFIIMGVLGRISIYTTTWICILFILAMTLGYSYVTINLIITLCLLIGLYFSWKAYIESK